MVLDRATITHSGCAAGFTKSVLVIRCEEESHCQNRERKKSVTGLEDSKKMITRLSFVFFPSIC